jgi:hypothetical protein
MQKTCGQFFHIYSMKIFCFIVFKNFILFFKIFALFLESFNHFLRRMVIVGVFCFSGAAGSTASRLIHQQLFYGLIPREGGVRAHGKTDSLKTCIFYQRLFEVAKTVHVFIHIVESMRKKNRQENRPKNGMSILF